MTKLKVAFSNSENASKSESFPQISIESLRLYFPRRKSGHNIKLTAYCQRLRGLENMKPNLHSPLQQGWSHTHIGNKIAFICLSTLSINTVPALAFVAAVLSSQIITQEFWCITRQSASRLNHTRSSAIVDSVMN